MRMLFDEKQLFIEKLLNNDINVDESNFKEFSKIFLETYKDINHIDDSLVNTFKAYGESRGATTLNYDELRRSPYTYSNKFSDKYWMDLNRDTWSLINYLKTIHKLYMPLLMFLLKSYHEMSILAKDDDDLRKRLGYLFPKNYSLKTKEELVNPEDEPPENEPTHEDEEEE